LRRARCGRRPDGCARRAPASRQRAFDHARSQGVGGVAGMPEGEGPRLSPRTVDDTASGQPRPRTWTSTASMVGTAGRRCTYPQRLGRLCPPYVSSRRAGPGRMKATRIVVSR
jgi:hypothetical protein